MAIYRSRHLVLPLVMLAMSSMATATVVFTGTVNPNDPSGVQPTTTVTIGPTSSSPVDADPRGGVEVNGGSQFPAGRVLVGDSIAALARMVVTGPQTKATVTSSGSFNAPSLIVGANGSGYLRVDDGA